MLGSAHLGHHQNDDDAYRAFLATQDHTWGSNSTKCAQGVLYVLAARHVSNTTTIAALEVAALGYVNYVHAASTRCTARGKTRRSHDAAMCRAAEARRGFGTCSYNGPPLIPPQGQPALESYRDWNPSWPENSWEITAIGYQGRYVRLLAALARGRR